MTDRSICWRKVLNLPQICSRSNSGKPLTTRCSARKLVDRRRPKTSMSCAISKYGYVREVYSQGTKNHQKKIWPNQYWSLFLPSSTASMITSERERGLCHAGPHGSCVQKPINQGPEAPKRCVLEVFECPIGIKKLAHGASKHPKKRCLSLNAKTKLSKPRLSKTCSLEAKLSASNTSSLSTPLKLPGRRINLMSPSSSPGDRPATGG